MLAFPVCEEAFEPSDADGMSDLADETFGLTLFFLWADPSADCGQCVLGFEFGYAFGVFAFAYAFDEFWNRNLYRTA